MASSSELSSGVLGGLGSSGSPSEKRLTRRTPIQHDFSLAQPTQVKDLSYTNKTLSRRERLTSSKWLKTAGITTLFVVGVIGLGGGAVTLCVITGNIPSVFAFLEVLQGAGSLGTIGMFAVGGLSTAGGAAWILGLIFTHYRKHHIPTMETKDAKMVGGALKSEKDFFLYHDTKTSTLLKVGKTTNGEVYREPVIPQLNENEVDNMMQQLAEAKRGEFVYQTLPGIDEFLSAEEIREIKKSGSDENSERLSEFLNDVPVLTQQAARAQAKAMHRPISLIYRRKKDNLVYGIKKVGDELIEKPIGTGEVFLVRFNVDTDTEEGNNLEILDVELYSSKEAKDTLKYYVDDELDDIPLQLTGRSERSFKGFYYINTEDGRLYSIVRTDKVQQTPEAAAVKTEEAVKEDETDAFDHFISCLVGKSKEDVTKLQERLLEEGKERWDKFPIFKQRFLESHRLTAEGLRETRELAGGRERLRDLLGLSDRELYTDFCALFYELLPKEGVVVDPHVEKGEADPKQAKALTKMGTTTPSTLFTPDTPAGIQIFLDHVQNAMVNTFRAEATMVDAVAVQTEIKEIEKAIVDEKRMAKRHLLDFNIKHGEYVKKRLKDLRQIGMEPPPFYEHAKERYHCIFGKSGDKSDEVQKVVDLDAAKAATGFIRQMYHQALQYIATHEGPFEILQRTDFKHINLDSNKARILREQLIKNQLYPQFSTKFGGQVAYLSRPFTDDNQDPSPMYVVAYVEVESGKFITRLLQKTDGKDMFWTSVPTQNLKKRLVLPKVLSEELDQLYRMQDTHKLEKLHGKTIYPLLTSIISEPAVSVDFENITVKFSGKKKDLPLFTSDMKVVPLHQDGISDKIYYIYCSSASGKYNYVIYHRVKLPTLIQQDEVKIYAYENDIKLTTHLANKHEVEISTAQKRAMINAIKNDKTHLIKQEKDELKHLSGSKIFDLERTFTKVGEYIAYMDEYNEICVSMACKDDDNIIAKAFMKDPITTRKEEMHVRVNEK